MYSLETIRRQFPGLHDKVFFDAACVSLVPQCAADAIQSFLDDAVHCRARSATLHHIAMDDARERARVESAKLINAKETDVVLVESTTAGLSAAARAIPMEPGDNIVTTDLEYLQVPLAWRQPAAGSVAEIRMVKNQEGAILVDDFIPLVDRRTRAVVVSSVQWSSGFRLDLAALTQFCREKGVFLVVDAIQQLGAFWIDVTQIPIDILVCGGHKWLNAPFGAGLMYVRSEADRLREPIAGYLAVNPPAGGWGEYFQTPSITPLQQVEFTREARRFEAGGTSNYPGAIGLAASLDLINSLGRQTVQGQIRVLTDRLFDGLRRLDVRVMTPEDPRRRSGIVTFEPPGGPAESPRLMEFLLDRKILVAVRYTSGVGGIRVSCHFFNTIDEVDELLLAVADYLSGR